MGALGAPLGRLLAALGALLDARGRFWTLLGALGALLGGFEVGFGRVWGGSGEGLGWFLQQASSSSDSKVVPHDVACFCLLLFAWACVCTTQCGTHFQLEL